MMDSINQPKVMPSSRQMTSSDTEEPMKMEELPLSGHVLAKDDPDNPQNLPLLTKIYVSAAATALAFVVFVDVSNVL